MSTNSRAMESGAARRPGLAGIGASFRFGLPAVVSRGRLLGALALLILVVVQFSALSPRDVESEGITVTTLFLGLVIGILIPTFTVSAASNALGTPVADGTLVYPWLRPVPRWQLALGHIGSALALNLPVALLTSLGAALAILNSAGDLGSSEAGPLLAGAAVAGAAAALAYTPLVVALGARYKRAATFAFVYIFLWEQVFARNSTGVSRFSIQSYVRGTFFGFVEERRLNDLATSVSGGPPGGGTPSPTLSWIVIAGLVVTGMVLTALVLRRADVE